MGAFHAHDGWFFERLANGDVRVTRRAGAHPEGKILNEFVAEKDEWASIVASVSAGGEEHGRFYAAQRFHAGTDPEPGY